MLSKLFTNDVNVLKMMSISIPFVAATQPLNTMAFVFYGINFGASEFSYATYSIVFVSIFTILFLLILSPYWGFIGIWIGLTIFMILRMVAGIWKILETEKLNDSIRSYCIFNCICLVAKEIIVLFHLGNLSHRRIKTW